ncbi:unnamed protein product [Cuscuta europaea]|uniref:RNase H type-1 domain-containing protein n=1 Tax=Cuscuta europaea TaxID=41803 RepID=A0A9P1E0C6_CUSEU|nr:unnamed protein product [Cuscuta europaea]
MNRGISTGVKITVDATRKVQESRWVWGCVGIYSNGQLLKARCRRAEGDWTPAEAEALGVREAILWARESKWRNVIVEVDVALIVSGVKGEKYSSIVRETFDDKKALLNEEENIYVQWCRRSTNQVAHALVKMTFSMYGCVRIFYFLSSFNVSQMANNQLN